MKKLVIIVGMLTAMACNSAGDKTAEGKAASDSVKAELIDPAKKMTLPEKTAAAPPVSAVYAGTLPCESCAELAVTLTLRSDSSFQKNSQYMGGRGVTGGTAKADTGKWMMKGDTLMLQSKMTKEKYLKNGLGLTLLDGKSKGKKAGSYILKQTN
jgi:uncharacterized lipoprotein NlpE involved in copper resistance